MDYLDPKKKRAHLIRLYIGYFLMAIAISFGTLILVFLASGYDVDRKTGEIIQNGLIILDANPHAATVYLNGRQERAKTSTRLTVPAGAYLVELKRPGYHDWRRQVSLEGGSVERLTYPILFPEKLTSTSLQNVISMPRAASSSPDRRYVVWQFAEQPDAFTFFDTNQPDKAPVVVTLPHNILSNPDELGQLTILDWASDARHLLLSNTLPNRVEYLMFDRQEPASSFSITKTFNIAPIKVALRDRHYDQFYALNIDNSLLTLDARNTPQATHLLSNVSDFSAFGSNALIYATTEGAPDNTVLVRFKNGDKTYPIHQLPKSPSYFLDLASYSGNWIMAVGAPSENKVYVYRNPDVYLNSNSDKRVAVPVSVLKVDDPRFVSFSSDYSIVSVQSGAKVAVYDNENNRQFQYQLNLPVPAVQKLSWMDGRHLCTVTGNKTLVSDFDGANQQQLSDSQDGLGCMFDKNYLHMYSFLAANGVTSLNSTLLELVNEPSDNILGF